MDTFVEKLPLSHIESGLAGEDARYLYNYWRRNNGIIEQDSGLTEISKRLMLFRPKLVLDDVPPSTLIGKDTTFRKYFPARNEAAEFPQAYRRKIAHGYHAALENEPWFDVQKTGSLMGEGTPDLILERLILKFRTSGGFERLFCLMTLVEDISRSRLSDPTHHHGRFQPGRDCYQSGLVHLPATAQHSHVTW